MPHCLYHHRLSFSSQIVRLAAREMNIPLVLIELDIGPRLENYDPAYMAINPRGVVPTLVDNGAIVTDCIRIVRHLQRVTESSALVSPDNKAGEMDCFWIARQQSIPERELSYSVIRGPLGVMARRSLPIRKRRLKRLAVQNPGLSQFYQAKLEDVRDWARFLNEPQKQAAVAARTRKTLDQLECHLAKSDYVAGGARGLSDIVWTVLLARLELLGLGDWFMTDRHPAIRAYYDRARNSQPFAQADIYRRVPKSLLLTSMVQQHGRAAAEIAAAAALIGLCWN